MRRTEAHRRQMRTLHRSIEGRHQHRVLRRNTAARRLHRSNTSSKPNTTRRSMGRTRMLPRMGILRTVINHETATDTIMALGRLMHYSFNLCISSIPYTITHFPPRSLLIPSALVLSPSTPSDCSCPMLLVAASWPRFLRVLRLILMVLIPLFFPLFLLIHLPRTTSIFVRKAYLLETRVSGHRVRQHTVQYTSNPGTNMYNYFTPHTDYSLHDGRCS